MKKLFGMAATAAALGGFVGSASGQEVLTGDTRLSCEAILCLSTGQRPGECTPSLTRYFGIKKKKWSDTVKARQDFLNMCPAANQTPEMSALASAMARGAGRCDAESLNSTLLMWTGGNDGRTYISNQLPEYCAAYIGHQYTDFRNGGVGPRYVGTPEKGGYWVEARDYDSALAEYTARLEAERKQQSANYWWR